MDLIVLSSGRIYREKDIHFKAPNGKIAILTAGSNGVETIDALEYQQRRSQPIKHNSLLEAINYVTEAPIKKIEHYRFLTTSGERIRVS